MFEAMADQLDKDWWATYLQSPELAAHWLSAIIESADDAIISKTLDGIITNWNRGAERIFGYTGDEVIGKPVTILIPADHRTPPDSDRGQLSLPFGSIRIGERGEAFSLAAGTFI